VKIVPGLPRARVASGPVRDADPVTWPQPYMTACGERTHCTATVILARAAWMLHSNDADCRKRAGFRGLSARCLVGLQQNEDTRRKLAPVSDWPAVRWTSFCGPGNGGTAIGPLSRATYPQGSCRFALKDRSRLRNHTRFRYLALSALYRTLRVNPYVRKGHFIEPTSPG
jgi:hypothetical protein